MKTSYVIGAVAAFALLGCAAAEWVREPQGASAAKSLPTARVAREFDGLCNIYSSPHELVLENTRGELTDLVYFPGCGWKYVGRGPSAGTGGLHKTAYVTQAAPAVPAAEDPIAVFIDGPTGYAFAWTPNGGWKYAGHIVDHGRMDD